MSETSENKIEKKNVNLKGKFYENTYFFEHHTYRKSHSHADKYYARKSAQTEKI